MRCWAPLSCDVEQVTKLTDHARCLQGLVQWRTYKDKVLKSLTKAL